MLVISAARGTGKSLYAKALAQAFDSYDPLSGKGQKSIVLTSQNYYQFMNEVIGAGRHSANVIIDEPGLLTKHQMETIFELEILELIDIKLMIGSPTSWYKDFIDNREKVLVWAWEDTAI